MPFQACTKFAGRDRYRPCGCCEIARQQTKCARDVSNVKNRSTGRLNACDRECRHLSCGHDRADTARQARSQGASVITAFNRRTHIRAFLVASIACFTLSHPASAAYTESWMSDHDVKTYAEQTRRAPVAASHAVAVKPALHRVRSKPNMPAVARAHATARTKSQPATASAKAPTVQHAAVATTQARVAAQPKANPLARASTPVQH